MKLFLLATVSAKSAPTGLPPRRADKPVRFNKVAGPGTQETASPRSGKVCASLYDGVNGSGNYENLTPGEENPNATGNMNNNIESVVVNAGCTVTLHADPDFGGESRECKGGTAGLLCNYEALSEWNMSYMGWVTNQNFQDTASSWKCECAEADVVVACNPDHATWGDIFGRGCDFYESDWCTPDGQKGPFWVMHNINFWSFHHYAVNGLDALSCPQCGCGRDTSQTDQDDQEEKPEKENPQNEKPEEENSENEKPEEENNGNEKPEEENPENGKPEEENSENEKTEEENSENEKTEEENPDENSENYAIIHPLIVWNDNFKKLITETFDEVSFSKNSYRQVENVTKRMRRRFNKFNCAPNAIADQAERSDLDSPCANLNQIVDNIIDWNDENLSNCGDSSSKIRKLAKNNHAKLQQVQKRLKRCSRKYTELNKN